MMKKIAALLAALLLALTLTLPVLAESEPLTMEGSLIGGFGYTVEEWMATDASRATFVTLAMLDMVLTGDERVSEVATEALLEGVLYVACDADSVACYLYGKSSCLMLDHVPGVGSTAEIIPMDGADPAALMEALKLKKQYTICEPIDVQMVLMMMEIVMGALVQ